MIEILKNVHLFKGSLIIRPHNFVRTWNTKMKGYLNSAVARVKNLEFFTKLSHFDFYIAIL